MANPWIQCKHLSIYPSIHLSIYPSYPSYPILSYPILSYLCIYVSMYLCIYVSMYLCMYVCIYLSIYLSIYAHYVHYICTNVAFGFPCLAMVATVKSGWSLDWPSAPCFSTRKLRLSGTPPSSDFSEKLQGEC